MAGRANVFAIHSWEDAVLCRRLEKLLRDADPDLAHYSVLPERALQGTPDEVMRSIESRIGFATAVVVVNSPGLHKRRTANLEMEAAVALDKRIVVVQPHSNFRQPIPQVLHGHIYRVTKWQSDVVGRAIRGEYPHDTRVFDIAEKADRRALIGIISASVAVVSFLVVVRSVGEWRAWQRELAAGGVELRWNNDATRTVVNNAALGLSIGFLVGLLTADLKSAAYIAGAGAAIGAAVGARSVYRASVLGTGPVRVLTVQPGP